MKTLDREDLSSDPTRQFHRWFEAAKRCRKILQPDAACLSTLGLDGYPSGRMVLLKSYDERGFVFYTNFQSAKGRSLSANPKAALTFFWETLGWQVRLAGRVEPVPDVEADEYFHSRPRLSQIGAWASHQSAVLKGRKELERRFKKFQVKFHGKAIPRPAYWGGFRLRPREVEFWQSRPNRLHDRFLYVRRGNRWKILQLNP